MKYLVLSVLLLIAPCYAQIGANAPSVPSTYLQSHPHLSAPTGAQLAALWAGRPTSEGGSNAAAYMWTDATAWSNSAPGLMYNCRHLILSTWVEELNSGSNAAAFLAKVQGFEPNAANWASGSGAYTEGWCDAMAYDFLYSYIGSTAQTNLRTGMYTLMSGSSGNCGAGGNEALFFISGSTNNSPWSDTNYTRMCIPEFEMAMAIYPDDPGNSLAHLRWALDKFYNYDMTAYKHSMTGDRGLATSDSSADNGGGMWNGWGDYQGDPPQPAMTDFFITDALNWSVASGIGASTWFTSLYPWMKDLQYWLPYELRPDWMLNNNVDITFATLDPEGSVYGVRPGYLNATAEVYNDATLRCIARTINNGGAAPNGFEPSAYPYYNPDSSANTGCSTGHQWLGSSSSLSPYKNFPGVGMINARTGFGEGDTSLWIEYGDSVWDHPIQQAGAFNVDHRGQLIINSGTYVAGSGSDEWQNWGARAISHNVPLLYDPNDYYGNGGAGGAITSPTQQEYWGWCRNFPGTPLFSLCPAGMTFAAPQNDGGQRPVGSGLGNQHFTYNGSTYVTSVGNVSAVQAEPQNEAMWNRTREWYHQGTLQGYAVGASNAYMAAWVDVTEAYNNTWSRNPFSTSSLFNSYTDNTTNRTFRCLKCVRGFIFIPIGGTSAVLVVDDQITANPLNYANIVKKDLVHTINQPTIGTPASGTTPFTVTRTETVTESDGTTWLSSGCSHLSNCNAGHTQYTYNGEMYGFLTWPQANGSTNCASGNFSCLTNVGGPGHEFQITDTSGTFNHSECMLGECGGAAGISGSVSFASITLTTGTNDALSITVDSGSAQTISLTAAGTCTNGVACTCATMIGGGNFNGQLTGATASCPLDPFTGNPRLAIASNNAVFSSGEITINTTANNAYTTLGFTVGGYGCATLGGHSCYVNGLGAVADFMHPSNLTGPVQPGSWTMYETIGQNNLSDEFTNVYLFQDAGTSQMTTAPVTTTESAGTGTCYANATGGCKVTTFTVTVGGNSCTYTITLPWGSEGVIQATNAGGSGCLHVL